MHLQLGCKQSGANWHGKWIEVVMHHLTRERRIPMLCSMPCHVCNWLAGAMRDEGKLVER